MAKKEQYYMERYNGNDYYTTNKALYDKKLKYYKWQDINTNCVMFCVLGFIVAMVALATQESMNWQCVASWVITGIGAAGCVATIILGIIAEKKINKYSGWKNEFGETKEFSRQAARYRKIEKAKQDKIKTEKATKLVESYEILDSKELSKQEKVNLIKKYIDIKEK